MKAYFWIFFLWTLAHTAKAAPIDEVLIVVQNRLAPQNVEAVYEFTNYRTDGTTSQYKVKFVIRDADHSRGYFLAPPREKGREILRLSDIIWSFVPSVGRTIRVADRDSFAGGDFSNADILRVDWQRQYQHALAKETPNQWVIDLTAQTPDASYAKMRLWVDKVTKQPVQQHFFDSQGTLLKISRYGTITTFGTIERPAHVEMSNVITKQKSELKVIDLKPNAKITDSVFVVDNLGK